MGLILAAVSAAGSTLADQWKEYFYCEAIPADTICVRALKKTQGLSSNHGNDNIISDGSIIAVADGQCMVIVEQGQVVDICAEPGEYKFDSKTEPSLFTGSLGEGIKNVFAQIGKRFTFGGQPANDQRVYYFNTKEIPGVKYGTPQPIPFEVNDARANVQFAVRLKAFGEYSIRVADPILFYTNVCANVSDSYKLSQIEDQMRSELLTALQPAFGRLSAQGIKYTEISLHTGELADALNEELSKKWRDLRGIEIVSFGVSSIRADEEDEKRLQQLQIAATYTDPTYAAANLAAAQMDAMRDAANNANGAAMGFVGLNAAQTAGGANVNTLFQQAAAQAQPSVTTPDPIQTAPAGGWTCPQCGNQNSGKFCSNCGTAKPVSDKWFCPECGQENAGKFCSNCGTPRP